MDKRLLQYYNRELQYMREMAGEFAREFPKIAGRLALDEFACADPYVERLLEGFAFLAARVHLKLDAEFPRLTQSILDIVCPHYLAPTPSMLVAQFLPDPAQSAALAEGVDLPRGTALRSIAGKGERTACEYRTAHPVTLLPLEIAEVAYHTRDLAMLEIPASLEARACIRLRLRTIGGVPFEKVHLDRLALYLRGTDEMPMRIYEQIFARGKGLLLQPPGASRAWNVFLGKEHIRPAGFDDENALLPQGARSFHGYRLLHEYFAFPSRFLFVELNGLAAGARRCKAGELEVIVLLDREDLELEGRLNQSAFSLFCAPAVNVFPKRADRIELTRRFSEFQVVPDRTRPLDFEVYRVTGVTGHGARSDEEQAFLPFYRMGRPAGADAGGNAFYTVNRVPRMESSREARMGRRSSYAGSEVYLSLVDDKEAPYRSDLRQLSVMTLCTNRDLPLQMALGRGTGDFTLEVNAPLASVRCVAGPTPPKPSFAEGELSWRLISHLSLNYLSLVERNDGQGAAALRDLLRLYGDIADPQIRKQIEGVKSAVCRPVVRRMPGQEPLAFVRGLEIAVTLEESAFEGSGVFLLGRVLERFMAKYVSINSFTETVIETVERGEIIRWPAQLGNRAIL